tara:strand:+ start:187 stop:873 length:687 start_codon:yes stop_codon:yes gene_type:complete
LENGAFSDKAMKKFGKKVVLFCHISSRVDGDPHQDLKAKRDTGGFPGLVFLDASGELLMEHNDNRRVMSFDTYADSLIELDKHQVALKGGDLAAAMPLLIQKMELGMLSDAAAAEERAKLGKLSASDARRLDELQRDLKIVNLIRTNDVRSAAGRTATARKLLELTKSEGLPKAGMAQREYWPLIASHAIATSDKKLLKAAIKATKKAYGKSIDERWVKEQERELKKM